MLLPKFWARSKINWPKKLDISSSLDVRSVNVLVGALRSSSDWFSRITHRITPPIHIVMLPKFWAESEINWTNKLHISSLLEFRSVNGVVMHCIILVIEFPTKLTEWLLPPYYDVAWVLGSIRNQLVKVIGHFKFIRCWFRKRSGRSFA